MPNSFSMGAIHEDPRKREKTPFYISNEHYGKMKDKHRKGETAEITESQLASATLASSVLIPSSFSLTTPPISNQGGEGSCVGFAVGYYARSVEYYYAKAATSYSNTVNVFSPEFLFNNIKSSTTCSGAGVITACDYLVNNGICLWNTVPYNASNGCAAITDAPTLTEAASYKISNYYQILGTDTTALKTRLMDGHALIIQVLPDQAFMDAGPSFIWSSQGTALGVHAIVVVGWDDSKNAFKIANQWGTAWGDTGFSWIDYTFFPQAVSSAISFGTAPAATLPVANAGFDQNVSGTSVILDGSRSTDPDGYIATYAWTKVSGPNNPTIGNSTSAIASISGLIAGSYVFKLTITDNSANTASDTVNVTVTSATTESYSSTVTKIVYSRKSVSDKVSWDIALNANPQSAVIETRYVKGKTTIRGEKAISPYTPVGSMTIDNVNTGYTRYYRLRIVKADGTTVYSTESYVK